MSRMYNIASLTDEDAIMIKDMERIFNEKTGKSCALVAWEQIQD